MQCCNQRKLLRCRWYWQCASTWWVPSNHGRGDGREESLHTLLLSLKDVILVEMTNLHNIYMCYRMTRIGWHYNLNFRNIAAWKTSLITSEEFGCKFDVDAIDMEQRVLLMKFVKYSFYSFQSSLIFFFFFFFSWELKQIIFCCC